MERTISDEEKIRKAIEISQRRNNRYYRVESARVNVNEKKNYKLFNKMILQIIICLLIYSIFYLITSTNYVFSEQVIKSTNEILNYDINFQEMYHNLMNFINSNNESNSNKILEANTSNIVLQSNNLIQVNNKEVVNNTQNNTANNVENNTSTNTIKEQSNKEEEEKEGEDEKNKETSKKKTQMELDAEEVKKVCKFTKPLSGKITSEFGEREVIAEGMTSDHKGIDIAATKGTNIKAAMEGTVKVSEENSEYGKFIKIVNGDVMTVYAHCNSLKVKVGDKIKMRTNNSHSWLNRSVNWTTFTF